MADGDRLVENFQGRSEWPKLREEAKRSGGKISDRDASRRDEKEDAIEVSLFLWSSSSASLGPSKVESRSERTSGVGIVPERSSKGRGRGDQRGRERRTRRRKRLTTVSIVIIAPSHICRLSVVADGTESSVLFEKEGAEDGSEFEVKSSPLQTHLHRHSVPVLLRRSREDCQWFRSSHRVDEWVVALSEEKNRRSVSTRCQRFQERDENTNENVGSQ